MEPEEQSVAERIKEMLPARAVVFGRAGSGKTPLLVKLLDDELDGAYDRLVVVCPTFWNQRNKHDKKLTFARLFHRVRGPRDVITEVTEDNLRRIIKQIITVYEQCEKANKKSPRTILLMDDLSGTKFYNSGRISTLSSFAVQCTHYNCSIFAITHQPTFLSPGLRDNSEIVIAFPSNRQQDLELLLREYRQIGLSKTKLIEMITMAWEAPKIKHKTHFLTILQKPGTSIEYFLDFDFKINSK
jgi:GTPase SAR1 family protein